MNDRDARPVDADDRPVAMKAEPGQRIASALRRRSGAEGEELELHALAEEDDPRIGMILQDRYEIVRKIGEGGMGAVYEGKHLLIRKRVAIKLLHVQFATNPEVVTRFHREAIAASEIGHANIVDVTDMGRLGDGTVYMVLEYLDGWDWSEALDAEGPQSLGAVVRVMTQVCDALEAAHHKDIIHRDLKPENIYLIERPSNPRFVKVLDFGISKVRERDNALTGTGQAIGTAFYMSPEQITGDRSIDHRADLYAMGVIMFNALTGQYPFMEEAFPMLLMRICVDVAPSVADLRPDLPPAFVTLIGKLLEKDPDDRYQTCAALRDALTPFSDVEDVPAMVVVGGDKVDSDAAHEATGLPNARSRAAHPKTAVRSSPRASSIIEELKAKRDELTQTRDGAIPGGTGAPAPEDRHEPLPGLPVRSKLPILVVAALALMMVAALLSVWDDGSETNEREPTTIEQRVAPPEPARNAAAEEETVVPDGVTPPAESELGAPDVEILHRPEPEVRSPEAPRSRGRREGGRATSPSSRATTPAPAYQPAPAEPPEPRPPTPEPATSDPETGLIPMPLL